MGKAALDFESYELLSLNMNNLNENDFQKKGSQEEMGLEITSMLRNDFKHAFLIIHVEIEYEDKKKLDLKVRGSFGITPELQEEEAKRLVEINGFAILYPYVRSIVSSVTSLDSPNSLLMPVLNVYDFFKTE